MAIPRPSPPEPPNVGGRVAGTSPAQRLRDQADALIRLAGEDQQRAKSLRHAAEELTDIAALLDARDEP